MEAPVPTTIAAVELVPEVSPEKLVEMPATVALMSLPRTVQVRLALSTQLGFDTEKPLTLTVPPPPPPPKEASSCPLGFVRMILPASADPVDTFTAPTSAADAAVGWLSGGDGGTAGTLRMSAMCPLFKGWKVKKAKGLDFFLVFSSASGVLCTRGASGQRPESAPLVFLEVI